MRVFSKLVVVVGSIFIATVSVAGAQSTGTVIDRMYENKLTIYQTPESFGLHQYVTRGEIAKFLNQYATTLQLEKNTSLSKCQFMDIEDYDITLIPHIIEACEYGLVKGFEGQYYPNKFISEAEALTIVIRSILGVQDESGDPWRTITHQKAQNLGIIAPVEVHTLDIPAQRGTIGKRLYSVATTYIPEATGKSSSDMYTSKVSSGGVTITFFDGTQTQIPSTKSQVSGYTQSAISPNTKYAALTTTGSQKPFVTFYDASTNRIQGEAQGSFKGWTDGGLARVETCYTTLKICEERSSISAETPWIFPEAWAEGGKIGFVCTPTDPMQASSPIQLSFNSNGELTPIKLDTKCSGIQSDMYSTYNIPQEAILGATTYSRGKEHHFYLLKSGSNYLLYTSGERDTTDTTPYEYSLLETFSAQ